MCDHANPFPDTDADRHALWDMLVRRDIEALLRQDWSGIADDFIDATFMGIDGRGSANPDSWRLAFPSVESYRDSWLKQAEAFAARSWLEDPEQALYAATSLRDIEINNEAALVHKKIDGRIKLSDGSAMALNWQTLYQCRRIEGRWKIVGFVGDLPNPMGGGVAGSEPRPARKAVPAGAGQHVTAGPYSPVLEVDAHKLVVISGQAAIKPNGEIVGQTIEEQARLTLENCRKQLASAGCGLDDVFKVNAYLTDLALWPRFNEVYRDMMPEPRPVRTAVGTALLPGLLVEVEMWAVKP